MIDVNIDDFYKDIAVILLSLYRQFPQKISLFVEDVSGPDTIDEFGLHSPRHMACVGAFQWLHDEGYVRYRDLARYEVADDCTLTQKAFSKLIKPHLNTEQSESASSIERQQSTLVFKLDEAIQAQAGVDVRYLIEEHFILEHV